MPPAVRSDEPEDWYALLGLSPTATADQIDLVLQRLASLADAESASAPERSRDLHLQIAAIRADLLSGTDRRRRYDEMLAHREWTAATRSGQPMEVAPSPWMQSPAMPSPAWPEPDQPHPAVQHPAVPYPDPGQDFDPWALAPGPVRGGASDAVTRLQPAPGGQHWNNGQHWAGYQAGGTGERGTDQPESAGPRAAGPASAGPQAGAGYEAGPAGYQAASGSWAGRTVARLLNFLRTAWTCPSCGYGALPADRFCRKCGSAIAPPRWATAEYDAFPRSPISPPVLCVGCGSRISAGNMYCTQCGTRRP